MATISAQPALYLDDIAVGDEYESGTHELDAAQIIAFASQFDPQPFHTDAEAATSSFFQGLAASGWHTMAITMKLIVESVPFAGGIVGAGGELSWLRPTRQATARRHHQRAFRHRMASTPYSGSLCRIEGGRLELHEPAALSPR